MVCTVSEYRSSEVLLFYTASIVVAVYGNVLTVFLNDFVFAVYPDAFNLVAGVFLAGYAVYAETVQTELFDFRSEFFGHSLHYAVGDGAVGGVIASCYGFIISRRMVVVTYGHTAVLRIIFVADGYAIFF